MYDLIIIGSGPAGMTAGIYAQRAGLDALVIERNFMSGGQIVDTYEVDNYPGFPSINGFDLAQKMRAHADQLGVQFKMGDVQKVEDLGEEKKVITAEETLTAKTVLFATGAKHSLLNIPGEAEYAGKGVSYCATCDGAFYKDKVVAVVGGGNAAVEEAIYLTRFASKVYLIHRRDELRADKIVQCRAFENPKLEFVFDSVVKEIVGEDCVKSLVLENVKSKELTNLSVDGVFPYIGISPNVDNFSGQITQDSKGFILTDDTMKTSIDGVFAVGDVRVTPLRQVITAAADGAISAVYASRYIESQKEIKVV